MKNQDFETILASIKDYNPKADFNLIKKAYRLAKEAHRGQKRLSGEAVIKHPLAVVQTLVDWRLDSVCLAAGLLHDVVEDSDVRLETISKQFGDEVAQLVDGVTKIGELKLRGNRQEAFVENFRKMIVVMAKDLRVVLIKLADRYHNMQTLDALPKDKHRRIARETLEIYAPLAERLGISEMGDVLEDLAFPYLYPRDYQWLEKYAAPYFKNTQNHLIKVKNKLLGKLTKAGIKAQFTPGLSTFTAFIRS